MIMDGFRFALAAVLEWVFAPIAVLQAYNLIELVPPGTLPVSKTLSLRCGRKEHPPPEVLVGVMVKFERHQLLMISAMNTKSSAPVFSTPCDAPDGVQVASPAFTTRLTPLSS